jgi:hypothetical protein
MINTGKLKKIENFGFKNSNEKPEELPKSLPNNLKLGRDALKVVSNLFLFFYISLVVGEDYSNSFKIQFQLFLMNIPQM